MRPWLAVHGEHALLRRKQHSLDAGGQGLNQGPIHPLQDTQMSGLVGLPFLLVWLFATYSEGKGQCQNFLFKITLSIKETQSMESVGTGFLCLLQG